MRGGRAQPGTCLQAQRSAGSPRLSLPSPLFALHSRSLCPGNTEVHPALLSHCPVNLFPLTASPVSGSPPPPISSLSSSILTRPSSRCDLLISHVLMLSHLCLCQRQGALGPGVCSDGPGLSCCGHISVTAQPARLLLWDAAPASNTEKWTQFHPALTATSLSPAADPSAAAGTGWITHVPAASAPAPATSSRAPKRQNIASVCISHFIHKL